MILRVFECCLTHRNGFTLASRRVTQTVGRSEGVDHKPDAPYYLDLDSSNMMAAPSQVERSAFSGGVFPKATIPRSLCRKW